MPSGGEIGLWLVYPDRHLPAGSRAPTDFLIAEWLDGVQAGLLGALGAAIG